MVGSRLLLALLFPTSKQKALAERESPGAREGEGRHPAVPQCLSLPLSLGWAGGGGGWLEELLVRLGSCWDPLGEGAGCWGGASPKAAAGEQSPLAERALWSQPFAGAKGGDASHWDSSCFRGSRTRMRLVQSLSEQGMGWDGLRCGSGFAGGSSEARQHLPAPDAANLPVCSRRNPGVGWEQSWGQGALAPFPIARMGEQIWQMWQTGGQALQEPRCPSFPCPPAWIRGLCSPAAP